MIAAFLCRLDALRSNFLTALHDGRLDALEDRGEDDAVWQSIESLETLRGLIWLGVGVLRELKAEGIVAGLGAATGEDEVADAA